MPCTVVKMPGGGTAIVCSRGRAQRCKCGKSATQLCDWKMPDKRSGTCDAPLCASCSHSPAPEKDLCPTHRDEWEARKRPSAPLGAPVQASLFDGES